MPHFLSLVQNKFNLASASLQLGTWTLKTPTKSMGSCPKTMGGLGHQDRAALKGRSVLRLRHITARHEVRMQDLLPKGELALKTPPSTWVCAPRLWLAWVQMEFGLGELS